MNVEAQLEDTRNDFDLLAGSEDLERSRGSYILLEGIREPTKKLEKIMARDGGARQKPVDKLGRRQSSQR